MTSMGHPHASLKLLIGKSCYKQTVTQSILPLLSHIIRQQQGPLPINNFKKDCGFPINNGMGRKCLRMGASEAGSIV